MKKIYRKILRLRINKKNKKRIKNKDFTIISSNCVGGVIYHELGLKFRSPTVNLFIQPKDFIKFCKNIPFYTKQQPKLLEGTTQNYPIVRISDITINCVHYKSFKEFTDSWKRRIKRINYNNIFIIMTERDGCTKEDLLQFDQLPFQNKIVFVHKDMPEIKSSYHIKGTELKDEYHKVVGLTKYKSIFSGKRFIDDFDYVTWLNNEGKR